tara:strand:- start:1862 stop:5152 length:3291 start_codon:yes stop_codon:yes gene_type:complete
MANNWKYLNFFDKNGKYYNFDYDSSADKWTGSIYLPEVSIGLFEVGQLFILEEFIDKNTNTKKFGFPHGIEVPTGTTGSTNGVCNWVAEWQTSDPTEIMLFQFNTNFNSGTQTSLEMEPDGPPLQVITELEIPLDYDPSETVSPEGYTVTNKITSQALQINLAIRAELENTFKRTLLITDDCTGAIIAEILVWGETVGEDERLSVMTQNMGYNILESDSDVFRNTNIKELLPDFEEVNLKRKEIMMEGSNIYPFIGSYKGLINAIKFFGYDTLKVKEFWKNVDANSPMFGKYIQSNNIDIFDPIVQLNDKSITLPNKKFRKTSLFSLVYRINKIVPDKFDDESLPITEENYDFTIEEILIKLFGLKKKLEREFLPLNARIKDITGEADFFGLLEVVNTISRNDKQEIVAGIDTNFKLSTADCIYMEDLRSFSDFCLASEAIVDEAIINYCNAYIAPISSAFGIGQNLLLGPITPGEVYPPAPIGPDLNGPLGNPSDGSNYLVSGLSDAFLAYFTRYAPKLSKVGAWPDGESSYYLPDKPGIPVGAMTVLENASFNNITWDNVDSTWNQLNDANTFFTFDVDPQGVYGGDVFTINDPSTNTGATYTALIGDTDTEVRDALYDQLITLKTSFAEPWVFWDITKETVGTGDVIRLFGQNVDRLKVTAESSVGSQLLFNQLPGETLFTWDGIERGNFDEIEWTIYKDASEVSPAYYKVFRGPLSQYNKLPLILPYVGIYSVEMKLFDLYNNISSNVKTDFICVESREVEYSGWYQSRKENYTWNSESKYLWNDYGSLWNLPIEPSITWADETPSLYSSLDRVNAILNNFGLGSSPDFQLLNYQDDGKASFSGPYRWDNLNKGGWNDTYHLWWDMTSTTGDTPAFFQFKEVVPETYLRITDANGETAEHYFDSTITTLAEAAAGLNTSKNRIINKYIYNVVYDASSNQKFVQAVCRYFGVHGDWKYIDIVYANGDRVCPTTGVTGVPFPTGDDDCPSLIYRKGLHKASNPTWNTAKFINNGKTLPKMSWLMFVYDKCKIPGKAKPRWIIKNTTNLNIADIYFESKYLTYLFKESGKYEITLELTDTNGNKYKKGRNILVIK